MQQVKRPTGLTIISILWGIASIFNLIVALNIINADLGALPLVSDPSIDEWYRFAIPAELSLGIFVVFVALTQMFTVYGLFTRKPWSYRLALTLLVLLVISNATQAALYLSAPPSIGLFGITNVIFVGGSIMWLVVVGWYLSQRHVQQYLGRTPPPTTPPTQTSTNPQ